MLRQWEQRILQRSCGGTRFAGTCKEVMYVPGTVMNVHSGNRVRAGRLLVAAWRSSPVDGWSPVRPRLTAVGTSYGKWIMVTTTGASYNQVAGAVPEAQAQSRGTGTFVVVRTVRWPTPLVIPDDLERIPPTTGFAVWFHGTSACHRRHVLLAELLELDQCSDDGEYSRGG